MSKEASILKNFDPDWNIQRIESPEALMSLEAEWRALEKLATNSALFSTFDYISIAWTHLHGPTDTLLVLVIREQGRMIAVAPFMTSCVNQRRIPIRIVEWLATLEGERPGSALCR